MYKILRFASCFTLCTTLLLLISFALPVFAQDPSADEVNQVAEKMNCPTCQSLNLADCRTQTCAQWRDQIKDLLAEGYTEQEVLDWYVTRYGEEVLQEPRRRGVGLFVWLLPVLALLVGAVWLVYILRTWSSKRAVLAQEDGNTPPQQEASTDYLKRIEQDLKDM